MSCKFATEFLRLVLVKAETFLSDRGFLIPEKLNLSLKLQALKLASETSTTMGRKYYVH